MKTSMTTKQKMFIGLIGLKELIAKKDVELLAGVHAAKDRNDGMIDEFEEFAKLQCI